MPDKRCWKDVCKNPILFQHKVSPPKVKYYFHQCFRLSNNSMHSEVWGYTEILPYLTFWISLRWPLLKSCSGIGGNHSHTYKQHNVNGQRPQLVSRCCHKCMEFKKPLLIIKNKTTLDDCVMYNDIPFHLLWNYVKCQKISWGKCPMLSNLLAFEWYCVQLSKQKVQTEHET